MCAFTLLFLLGLVFWTHLSDIGAGLGLAIFDYKWCLSFFLYTFEPHLNLPLLLSPSPDGKWQWMRRWFRKDQYHLILSVSSHPFSCYLFSPPFLTSFSNLPNSPDSVIPSKWWASETRYTILKGFVNWQMVQWSRWNCSASHYGAGKKKKLLPQNVTETQFSFNKPMHTEVHT